MMTLARWRARSPKSEEGEGGEEMPDDSQEL